MKGRRLQCDSRGQKEAGSVRGQGPASAPSFQLRRLAEHGRCARWRGGRGQAWPSGKDEKVRGVTRSWGGKRGGAGGLGSEARAAGDGPAGAFRPWCRGNRPVTALSPVAAPRGVRRAAWAQSRSAVSRAGGSESAALPCCPAATVTRRDGQQADR